MLRHSSSLIRSSQCMQRTTPEPMRRSAQQRCADWSGRGPGAASCRFTASRRTNACQATHLCNATACHTQSTRHAAGSDRVRDRGTRGLATAGSWSAAGWLQPPDVAKSVTGAEDPTVVGQEEEPPCFEEHRQAKPNHLLFRNHLPALRSLSGSLPTNQAAQRSAPSSTTPRYGAPPTSSWLAREAGLLR